MWWHTTAQNLCKLIGFCFTIGQQTKKKKKENQKSFIYLCIYQLNHISSIHSILFVLIFRTCFDAYAVRWPQGNRKQCNNGDCYDYFSLSFFKMMINFHTAIQNNGHFSSTFPIPNWQLSVVNFRNTIQLNSLIDNVTFYISNRFRWHKTTNEVPFQDNRNANRKLFPNVMHILMISSVHFFQSMCLFLCVW